jgi:hypothetical protein
VYSIYKGLGIRKDEKKKNKVKLRGRTMKKPKRKYT